MKTIVVTQSNYLPWKGYFDQIRRADLLIVLDCVQYTRRDWRNRNQIKTPRGLQWISVPVKVTGRYHQPIDETQIADPEWAARHISVIEENYRRARAYEDEAPWLYAQLQTAAEAPNISAVNRGLTEALCRRIGIDTPFEACDEILARAELIEMDPTDRLLALCRESGATRYLSGPAAQDYLDVDAFRAAGIDVVWMDYAGYPEYEQLWEGFAHNVSIVDLLLNVGAGDALRFLDRTCS